MESEKEELITKLATEGKNKADVRRALISIGYSTEGFEELYDSIRKEIPEEVKVSEKKVAGGVILGDYKSFDTRPKQVQKNPLGLIAFILILCAGAYFAWSQGYTISTLEQMVFGGVSTTATSTENENLTVTDRLIQTKVESTAVSANLFGGTMGSYDGVCGDISVLEPVECLQSSASFVVFAPVGSGAYYCVDSSEFRGTVKNRPNSPLSCQ